MFLTCDQEDKYKQIKESIELDLSNLIGYQVDLSESATDDYAKAFNVIIQHMASYLCNIESRMDDIIKDLASIGDKVNPSDIEQPAYIDEMSTMEITKEYPLRHCHFCDSLNVNSVYSEYHDKGYLICKAHEYLVK